MGEPQKGDQRALENARWDTFYSHKEKTPPWESMEPFSGLVRFVNSKEHGLLNSGSQARCIELGSGASASAVYLASQGFKVCAIDVSPKAIERARRLFPESAVRWEQQDILSPVWDGALEEKSYDFVFDMQCWHVLRLKAEEKCTQLIQYLLRPHGYAMMVVGADTTHEDVEPEPILNPGPPIITKEAFIEIFSRHCPELELKSITLSRFNITPDYAARLEVPPRCWVAVFQRRL